MDEYSVFIILTYRFGNVNMFFARGGVSEPGGKFAAILLLAGAESGDMGIAAL